MKKLIDILNHWIDGKKYPGVKIPPLETIHELMGIASGEQKTTINSTVIKFLDICKIAYKPEGIGWRIVAQ